MMKLIACLSLAFLVSAIAWSVDTMEWNSLESAPIVMRDTSAGVVLQARVMRDISTGVVLQARMDVAYSPFWQDEADPTECTVRLMVRSYGQPDVLLFQSDPGETGMYTIDATLLPRGYFTLLHYIFDESGAHVATGGLVDTKEKTVFNTQIPEPAVLGLLACLLLCVRRHD